MTHFRNWDKLLYGIDRGECVLFLGPELPLVDAGGARRSPLHELGNRLVADRAGEDLDPRNAAAVAQRFVGPDELDLERLLVGWHGSLQGQPSPLHDDLAALPFRWIVTSAHDPLMEAALARHQGKQAVVDRYHYRGRNKELLPEPTVEQPVLFHLYGHVAEPASVVLAETQLVAFLTHLIAGDPPLPRDLEAALANSRLFLFLGFGLRQWYLRILLHVLKVLRPGISSFAIEPPGGHAGAGDDAVLFYRQNYKVEVHSLDAVEFVRELRSRWTPPEPSAEGDEGAAAESRAAEAEPGAATVFICHASEDAERAEEINAALRRAGLDPWLDKEQLRGGTRWNEAIERTIEEVDYVVVLNSRSLATKSRGKSYVNKEINAALEAARRVLQGAFIVPARLDDARLLGALEDFQAVDLRADRGLQDLVRAIKRDLHERSGGGA